MNKTDLADPSELQIFTDLYGKYYSVYFVEAQSGKGVDGLREALRGKQAALAGASGTGKSTLTNLLIGEGASQAGEISSRTLRGKNTTRHTELFAGDGFYLFDTPGFTSFDTADMEESELALYFPEFEPYLHRCGFSDCTHIAEKSCAVRQAVRDGLVSKQRYRSFKEMYLELKERNSY